MRTAGLRRLALGLASLKLTLVLFLLLMLLVGACTLDQVEWGTFKAVERTMRSFFLWWRPAQSPWPIPVFPGGASVGLLLIANLLANFAARFEASPRKAGLWLVHFGLILLLAGEFVSGALQVDARMALREGETADYSESDREMELAVTDASGPDQDTVYSVPLSLVAGRGELSHPDWPFTLLVKRFVPNAALRPRPPGEAGLPSLATAGPGRRLEVQELAAQTRDDRADQPAAFIEAARWDRSLGTWLLSPLLGAPQGFAHGGREFRLALRPKRRPLGFSITLLDFAHDRYPGTEIPKNFSSRVRLLDPLRGQDREALISMNDPLRYAGRTFYQASFGEEDTLSVLQVVSNPGWRLPYLACALVAAGLLWQFFMSWSRSRRERPA